MALYDLLPEGALSAFGIQPQPTQGVGIQPTAQPTGILGTPAAASAPMSATPAAAPQSFNFGNALEGLGRGLVIAGSRDPASAFLAFSKADAEDKESRKPKVTPLAGGAFSLVSYPDGRTEIIRNQDVAKFLSDQSAAKFERDKEKITFTKEAEVNAAAGKDDIKRGGEAREQLNQTQALIDGWTKAAEIVEKQIQESPTMAKVQGLAPGVAGFFGGDQVAANKFLQGLKVDETLLNTARTKGAISDAEMLLFQSPLPSLSDDREKVWKPYIEQRMPVIKKLMEFQKSEAARADNPAARVTGGSSQGSASSSSSSPQIKPATEAEVRAAGLVFDPAFEYAYVDGKIRRKPRE